MRIVQIGRLEGANANLHCSPSLELGRTPRPQQRFLGSRRSHTAVESPAVAWLASRVLGSEGCCHLADAIRRCTPGRWELLEHSGLGFLCQATAGWHLLRRTVPVGLGEPETKDSPTEHGAPGSI